MAVRDYTTSAIKTTAAALGFVLVAATSPANATPIYHLTICGGSTPQPGGSCYVQTPTVAPNTAGLTDGALAQFLTDNGVGTVFSVSSFNIRANAAGYVWGEEGGEFMLDGGFIARNGTFLCCTIDGGRIDGINDRGLILWRDGDGTSYLADSFGTFSPAFDFPSLDTATVAYLSGDPIEFLRDSHYLAIDNLDRVSGMSPLGSFILEPTDPNPSSVPEPGSLALLVGALVLWRINRETSPTRYKDRRMSAG